MIVRRRPARPTSARRDFGSRELSTPHNRISLRPSASALIAGAATAAALLLPQGAAAGGIGKQRPDPAYDWSGFYVGAHAGYVRGHAGATLQDATSVAQNSNGAGGITAGAQAGYNFVTGSNLLLGVEADISFPSYLPQNAVLSEFDNGTANTLQHLDYYGTVRARLGVIAGRWLGYVTGGLAFEHERYLTDPDVGRVMNARIGWAAGAGVEYGFTPNWSARVEYLYSQYQNATVDLPTGASYATSLNLQTVRVGVNRKMDWFGTGSTDAFPSLAAVADQVRPLGDPWPDHFHRAGLPVVPGAL